MLFKLRHFGTEFLYQNDLPAQDIYAGEYMLSLERLIYYFNDSTLFEFINARLQNAVYKFNRSRCRNSPLTLSDSSGYIYDPEDIDQSKLAFVKRLKNIKRCRIREYVDKYSETTYTEADSSLFFCYLRFN